MIAEDLVAAIEEDLKNGFHPFYIGATMGTTVLGAVDPIDKLVEVKNKYNLYLHIDGCYGGHLLLIDSFKNSIKNIAQVDSFTWDMHKVLPVT